MPANLQTLAHHNLPLVGQQALSNCADLKAKTILAHAPQTDITVINKLAQNQQHDETRETIELAAAALGRTTNTDLLEDLLNEYNDALQDAKMSFSLRANSVLEAISQNPLTPPDVLTRMLTSPDERLRARASCNPTTPEEARQKHITNESVSLMGRNLQTLVHDTIHHEIVLANPWMVNIAKGWNENIQRATIGSPIVTRTTLLLFARVDDYRKTAAKRHPARNKIDMTTLTVEELLATDAVAAQIHALDRPEFAATHAKQIINTVHKNLRLGLYRPDAHITGRLVNRYGISLIAAGSGPDDITHSDDRGIAIKWCRHLDAASWVAPVLAHSNTQITQATAQSIEAACGILGDKPNNWNAYVALLNDWHGNYMEAALTATRL